VSATAASAANVYWVNTLAGSLTTALTPSANLYALKRLAGAVATSASTSSGLLRINAVAASAACSLASGVAHTKVVKNLSGEADVHLDFAVELQGTCTLDATAETLAHADADLRAVKTLSCDEHTDARAVADLVPVRTLSANSQVVAAALATVHLTKTLSGVSVVVTHCEGGVVRYLPGGLARLSVEVLVPTIRSSVDAGNVVSRVSSDQLVAIVAPDSICLTAVAETFHAVVDLEATAPALKAA
jgi:hypothetical protein